MPLGPIAMLGIQLGGQLLGSTANQAIGNHLQYKQQEKLLGLQTEKSKELADYQHELAYDMWNKTNYSAQVDQLKMAGLNPGLLYGMGGAGGATTGPGGMPMPTTAQAEGGSAMAAHAAQFDLMLKKAQLNLMDAQADNLKADAENKRGVEREKTEAETQNLLQGYDNLREEYEYKRAITAYQRLQNWQLEATNEDRVELIKYDVRRSKEALRELEFKNKITEETLQDEITKIRYQAIGAGLTNLLTIKNVQRTQEEIRLMARELQNMYEHNEREWMKMSQQERELIIKEALKDWETDLGKWGVEQLIGILKSANYVTDPKTGKTYQKNVPLSQTNRQSKIPRQ